MKKYIYTLALAIGMVALAGCDLTERNYSNVDAQVYYQNENSIRGAVAAIYAAAGNGFCEYFGQLQEFSADQVAWRTWNGGSWGWDEGAKFVLSSHTWTSEATIVDQAWGSAWKTIGLCNQLIMDLESLDANNLGITDADLKAYIAEIRTIRAWAYYNNFELWGGALPLCVEVTTEVPGSADLDFNKGCKKVYEFIEKELDESVDALVDKGATRVSKAMNRMLKMRLLLNAEIFIGEDHYADCAAVAKDLLENKDHKYGDHSVVSDFREVFQIDNEKCPEVVFAFALKQGAIFQARNMRDTPFLPYTYVDFLQPFAVGDVSGWNCVCLTPSYDNNGTDLAGAPTVNADGTAYNSSDPRCFLGAPYNHKLGAVYERFEAGDIRKQSYDFPVGGKWNGGLFLKGAMKDRTTGEAILADADRQDAPLIYVDQVGQFGGTVEGGQAHPKEDVESPRWGQTNSGYRLMKYPMYPVETGIDYHEIAEVEFRWAEIIYTLAECNMRTDGTDPRSYISTEVLYRYFNGAVTDNVAGSWSKEEWMLHQWGLEFLNEGRRRRTDLRRFDKFTNGEWWFFGQAKQDDGATFPAKRDSKYEWFPLPQKALGVNPGLVQNPNY